MPTEAEKVIQGTEMLNILSSLKLEDTVIHGHRSVIVPIATLSEDGVDLETPHLLLQLYATSGESYMLAFPLSVVGSLRSVMLESEAWMTSSDPAWEHGVVDP